MTHVTRESWLVGAVDGLRLWFVEVGSPIVVPVRVTMGFPSSRALSLKKRTVGQCWPVGASTDGHAEILVSPLLDDPVEILGVVAHELGHAALGPEIGHRAPFARLAKALDLEGKPTATTVGDAFRARSEPLIRYLGALPHSRLDPNVRPVKKDGVRQLKCECASCGYVARTTRKWLDLSGPPVCPACEIPMTEDTSKET